MCGVAGIYQRGAKKAELLPQMLSMLGAIKHRGPDDQGQFVIDQLAIGMTRLSIIDLVSGSQPISNQDNSIILVCNGEIYNYLELKDMLQKKGYIFKTNSDVEVIIHGYDEFGENFINQLRGMFAFCLWDSKKEQIWLARDRLGIKPLYFYQNENKFIFSSEIKAILAVDKNKTTFNHNQVRIILSKRYTDSDKTIFNGISKVPPGNYFLINKNKIIKKEYWSVKRDSVDIEDIESYIDQYQEKLEDSIMSHLISDVPVGSFLSGGLDSSIVTAVAAKQLNNEISTYTIGFNSNNSEHLFARAASNHINTNHIEEIIGDVNIGLLEKVMWHLEEPINDPAVLPTFILSKIASQSSKVVLTGEGSDEINAGYNKYRYELYNKGVFGKMLHLIPNGMLKTFSERSILYDNRITNSLRRRIGYALSQKDSYLYSDSSLLQAIGGFNLFSKDFIESTNHSYNDSLQNTFGEGLDDYFEHDFRGFLANDLLLKVDKMTMAHSLEARVPFLDHKFVEYCYRIPHLYKMDKNISKKILRKYSDKYLSKEILKRPQHGFLSPIETWLRSSWNKDFEEILNNGFLIKEKIVRKESIEKLFVSMKQGNRNADSLIWAMAMMNISHDIFTRN